jgi:hypothetical protein
VKGKGASKNSAPIARYILVLYQGIDPYGPDDALDAGLVMRLRHQFEATIREPAANVEIDVWLESPGGDAHAAYKLALLLRAACSRLRVVVPDYAKSAATLLTIAADEIYMAAAAELGPLDAQIPREGGFVSSISALDLARSVDDLAQVGLDLAVNGGAYVLRETRLTRAESLRLLLEFSAQFMEPIVRQLEPALIHWSSTLLNVSVAYGGRLLLMRRADTPPALPYLADTLVEDYPTHGFVISRSEARDRLRLPVKDLDSYDLWEEACRRHRMFEDGDHNVVELVRVEDLGKPENGENGENQATAND